MSTTEEQSLLNPPPETTPPTTQTAETSAPSETTTNEGGDPPSPPQTDLLQKPADEGTKEALPGFDLAEVALEDFKKGIPEGFETSDESAGKFLSILNASKSRAELATNLTSFYAEMQKAEADTVAAQWNTTMEEWKNKTKADPEIGGAKLEKALAGVHQFVKDFAGKEADEVYALLSQSGLANHPAMLRMLSRAAGKLSTEATLVNGNVAKGNNDLAAKLFPSTPSGVN
jgi:hypothetical protein